MELVILEQSKNKLIALFKQTPTTIINSLAKELVADSAVVHASATIDHPITNNPKLFIETSKKTPVQALKDAISRLKKINNDCAKALK